MRKEASGCEDISPGETAGALFNLDGRLTLARSAPPLAADVVT